MARDFNGSSAFLQGGNSVAAEACTMACWFNPDSTTADGVLMSLSTSGGTARWQIEINITDAKIGAASVNSAGTAARATTATSHTTAAWQHALALFTSSTSRTIYLNGGNSANNTTSIAVSANRTLIGARITAGATGLFYDGKIGDAAIWSTTLDASEISALAKGFSPLLIRPQSLVFHAPLVNSVLESKGMALTDTSTANVADHPRIYRRDL